jgi:hypothetical protein
MKIPRSKIIEIVELSDICTDGFNLYKTRHRGMDDTIVFAIEPGGEEHTICLSEFEFETHDNVHVIAQCINDAEDVYQFRFMKAPDKTSGATMAMDALADFL